MPLLWTPGGGLVSAYSFPLCTPALISPGLSPGDPEKNQTLIAVEAISSSW